MAHRRKQIHTNAESLNAVVASRLDEVVRSLKEEEVNSFRVAAYRRAAATLRELKKPVLEIVQLEGVEGLKKLPGIGETLARFIYHAVLDEQSVRAIEPVEKYPRLLSRANTDRPTASRATIGVQPSVAEILDVDREYRQKEHANLLPTISPRKFNPQHEKWLPILHTRRGDRHYTALFSNTMRAHQLNKTFDWVVIYYDGTGDELQCTVITSLYGPLRGRRIVRGREAECLQYYLGNLQTVEDKQSIQTEFSF